jgi:hypothetical protein
VSIPPGWLLTEVEDIVILGNVVTVIGNGTNSTGDPEGWIARYSLEAPPATALSLNADSSCYDVGDTVTITVDVTDLTTAAVGGQFFLDYDASKLAFVSAEPGGTGDPANPFDVEIFECAGHSIVGVCVPNAGEVEYAVGVPNGNLGSADDNTMARFTFIALAQVCHVEELVTFRDNGPNPPTPPTRISDALAQPISAELNDLHEITIDTTDPEITCPPNITTYADVGLCSAVVSVGTASATDNCDTAVDISGVRSDSLALNAPYPATGYGGPITITWTATDDCGNIDTCQQIITVNPVNRMLVDIELDAVTASFTRCIRFELYACPNTTPVIVDAEVAFTGGLATDAEVFVPCGVYNCVTARDRKHTLRRTDESFGTLGNNYDAHFTGLDRLIGGNLNDDAYNDILDFGGFIGQFNQNVGANTPCNLAGIHADFSGNGFVLAEDYTYIANNFLIAREASCCGLGDSGGAVPDEPGPITAITVRELNARGLHKLAAGDLNHDGWLDLTDVQVFLQGGGGSP